MLKITIDENGEEIAANLRRWPDHRSQYVGKHLQVLGNKVADVMHGYMQRHRYTGEGARSLTVTANAGNGNQDWVEIGPAAQHWRYVAWGTPPHWPPYAPIAAWCLYRFGDNSFATVRGVQAKIAREGTEPDPFLRETLEDNRTADALRQAAEAIGTTLVGVIEGKE